jgi:replication initiation protein RepC
MSLKAIATSAFGRRRVTRAQITAQLAVDDARAGNAEGQGGAVHKWALMRTLSEIRDGLGVSDRALGVLSALVSFHPETALTLDPERAGQGGDAQGGAFAGLVVFPSNRALSLRANGMTEPTLRRHLAALVEAGLIIRRDSPNGKRYARRCADREGDEVVQAFGFDLAPLVARAAEFEARLEALQAERRRARLLKERVNLLRRDVSKRLAFALDEALQGPWDALRLRFLALCTPLRKLRGTGDFEALADALDALQADVATAIANAFRGAARRASEARESRHMSGDAAHFERRFTESNTDQIKDIEPDFQGSGEQLGEKADERAQPGREAPQDAARELPLSLVLQACPDISDYAFADGPPETWRAFVDVAETVRPMLGISPDAWRAALDAMGAKQAAAAIAFLLQRSEHSSEAARHVGEDGRIAVTVNGSPAIRAPGGYLRALTDKAKGGGAPLWGALLAHLAQRRKATAPQLAKPFGERAGR